MERMLDQMKRLIEAFSVHIQDRSTLDELHRMIDDPSSCHKAHDLFSCIRKKTLDAVKRKHARASRQYSFEELCAKTIYNLTNTDAPFDNDSPYWIIPQALLLARQLGVDEAVITTIVTL
jgi:hypothetical protein